jgi:hypothetical protein
VEDGHDAGLEDGVEVDEEIAATDEVEAGERRIGGDVLAGESRAMFSM